MECPKCKGPSFKNGSKDGKQRYVCKNCNYNYWGGGVVRATSKIGISLNRFRELHDVDYIVDATLKKLDKNIIYERNDIYKMTGLRPGYPGLKDTVEAHTKYYGKISSTLYFSHPDTIAELKDQAKLM